MKRERKELPFTNKFGDTINPGDAVYAITTCTHRTYITKGEYLGYVETSGYDYKTRSATLIPKVQVRFPAVKYAHFDKKTGKLFNWNDYTYEYYKENVERQEIPTHRVSTLVYNNILPANTSTETLAKAV